jgi:hypothetical protein
MSSSIEIRVKYIFIYHKSGFVAKAFRKLEKWIVKIS